MAIRHRLMHVAAGIADSFISRNNDLFGYWAPGLMYQEVPDAPSSAILNLLTGSAEPNTSYCGQVARNYAVFLERASSKQNVPLDALTLALIQVQFNAAAPTDRFRPDWSGDPFQVAVVLRAQGREGIATRGGRCQPYVAGHFTRRYGGLEALPLLPKNAR